MLYEINEENLSILKDLNQSYISMNGKLTHHLVLYITRNSKPTAHLGIYTRSEWLITQQFVIASEYQKSLIDIYISIDITKTVAKSVSNLVQIKESPFQIGY